MEDVKPNIVIVLKIIKLNATDSTNSHLKRMVAETEVEDETAVVAEEQKNGRGQMGNGWLSRKGQSLTFSIFKGFKVLSADRQFVVSMATSLAIAEALKNLGIPKVSIKWPNDILSGSKKVGGILIENVLEKSSIKHSIIGIGINVNEIDFPQLPHASSLKLETGRTIQMEAVFELLLKKILERLKDVSNHDFFDLKEEYEMNLFRRNTISVFENSDGKRFNGRILGISEIGELMVETENASVVKYQLKELRLIY